jgi:hypothetical protein
MIVDRLAKILGIGRQAAQIEDSRARAHSNIKRLLDDVVSQNRHTSESLKQLVGELQAMRDDDEARMGKR